MMIDYPELPYQSIEKDLEEKNNTNKQLCAECGGQCCKRCGCYCSPDDFKEISFEFLKKELEKGYYSIEYVDGELINEDSGMYIVRARNSEAPIVDDFDSKRSACVLLGEKGCKLEYAKRPTGGKLLIPTQQTQTLFNGKKVRKCDPKYDLNDCCYEWAPHQRILHSLAEYFKDKDIQCSL